MKHATPHLDKLVVVPCTQQAAEPDLPFELASNAQHSHDRVQWMKSRAGWVCTLGIEDVVALVSLLQRQDVADDRLRPQLALLLQCMDTRSRFGWNR